MVSYLFFLGLLTLKVPKNTISFACDNNFPVGVVYVSGLTHILDIIAHDVSKSHPPRESPVYDLLSQDSPLCQGETYGPKYIKNLGSKTVIFHNASERRSCHFSLFTIYAYN